MLLLSLFISASAWTYHSKGSDWEGVCSNGTSQSPIDIASSSVSHIPLSSPNHVHIAFDFSTVELQGSQTASNYMIKGNLGSIKGIKPDQSFHTGNIIQLHFHAPAENHIESLEHDLEMHIVMTDANNTFEYLVFAVFFKNSSENSAFIDNVIKSNETFVNFTLIDLFNSTGTDDFYAFLGSLTTPPCTENVLWMVDTHVRNLSTDQLEKFTKNWAGSPDFAGGNGNDRELQFTNGREVIHFTSHSLLVSLSFLLVLILA